MSGLDGEMVLVLAILAGTVALFVTEVVRVDVVAVLVMVTLGLTGLVPAGEVFAGFASNAVIAIIAVMILGSALDRVGVMRSVAGWVLRLGGRTERRVSATISAAVGLISAFVQNIGAAALFLPVAERVAERSGLAISRLLMPMGFAAILGGTLTLVASGPLILLNELLASSAATIGVDIEPYGLFAPTPIGIALLASGIALFALFGRHLLPATATDTTTDVRPDIAAVYGLDRTLHPYRIPESSPLVGRTIGVVEAEHPGVRIVASSDADGLAVAPHRDERLTAGSALALGGADDEVQGFADHHGLRSVEVDPFGLLQDTEHAGLAEVVVRPGSPAVGRHLEELRLRKEYGIVVLGIHQRDETVTDDLRAHRLAAGDVLVVFTPWDRLRRLDTDPSFVVLTEHPPEPARTRKRWWALGALAVALTLVLVAGLQLSLALMTGVAILLVGRVLSPDEAYRAVSWKTVFLLAGLIPLGQAVETTGTAAWIASGVIDTVGDLPPWTVQLTIAVLATAFTLIISNLGATVLLVPLAVNVAVGVGADPAQFGLIVALAASNAFVLPTHQVNALLMTPGGYGVRDYVRAGAAMSVVFLVVLILTVNLFA